MRRKVCWQETCLFNSTPYFFPLGLSDRVCLLGSHVACHLESSHFLEIVHAFLSAGTVCFLYRLVLPHVRQSSAQLMALLLTVFPLCVHLDYGVNQSDCLCLFSSFWGFGFCTARIRTAFVFGGTLCAALPFRWGTCFVRKA